MGFESGSVGFMMFTVPQGLPPTCIDRFAAYALPPIDTLSTGSISGWVTGRHLLDSAITNETAHFAGRLRLALAKAERKVPESLLRAECRMEELAVMAAEGKDYVDRRTRSEIKRQVTERLLPRMPPTLTGIPIVYEAGSHILYAGATTEKQHDALVLALREALGVTAIAVTPLTAAVERKHVRVDELPPCSFSPEIEDILGGNTPGKDFLTWLWFFFEARGGTMQVDGQTCAVMIEGPLTFYIEGQGAHDRYPRFDRLIVEVELGAVQSR